MRIGIDARTILNPGKGEQAGVGHYTYYLIKHLLAADKRNTYVLFLDSRVLNVDEFRAPNVEIVYFPFYQYKSLLPVTYSHLLVSAIVSRAKVDVFHSPASTIPLVYLKSSVVTIHDLAIYKHKKWFPGRQQFSTRILVPRTLRQVNRIIAVSDATRRDIEEVFQIPSKKITVVHNGVLPVPASELAEAHRAKLEAKYGLKGQYVLFLGTIEPRKNLHRLIEACYLLRARKQFADVKLVIAGGQGWLSRDLVTYIEKLKMQDAVVFTGYVSHRTKVNLMKHASAFVFPSLYEGFGLSLLEAMEIGTPVVTSRVSSMPEVAGDAAELVDPEDVKDITRGISRVLLDDKLRAELVARGHKRAEELRWSECARQTLAVYESVHAETAGAELGAVATKV